MRRLVLALGFVVLPLAFAPAAGATPPTALTIAERVDLSTGQGTFVAAGPLCASGTTAGELRALGGFLHGGFAKEAPMIALTVLNTFTCADGSGTFTVQLHNQGAFTSTTLSGPWAIIGGTGAYSTLHGVGETVLVVNEETRQGIATYTGHVHSD